MGQLLPGYPPDDGTSETLVLNQQDDPRIKGHHSVGDHSSPYINNINIQDGENGEDSSTISPLTKAGNTGGNFAARDGKLLKLKR